MKTAYYMITGAILSVAFAICSVTAIAYTMLYIYTMFIYTAALPTLVIKNMIGVVLMLSALLIAYKVCTNRVTIDIEKIIYAIESVTLNCYISLFYCSMLFIIVWVFKLFCFGF
jgi:hypothetical protein